MIDLMEDVVVFILIVMLFYVVVVVSRFVVFVLLYMCVELIFGGRVLKFIEVFCFWLSVVVVGVLFEVVIILLRLVLV